MRSAMLTMASALCVLAGADVKAADRTFGDGTLPDHLAVYDVDTNGVLSVEEIQAMKAARRERHDQLVAQWDTNQDGVIDPTEQAAARDALRADISERRANHFAEADLDHNGCIDFAEFIQIPAVTNIARVNTNAPVMMYNHLDMNHDQCVDTNEFMATLNHQRIDWRNPGTFAMADANTNGCLTLTEFGSIPEVRRIGEQNPSAPAQIFAQLDLDTNACLTAMEFLAPQAPPRPPEWRTPATFAAADRDTDTFLSLLEFGAIPEVQRMAQTQPNPQDFIQMLFRGLDANVDTKLTLDEFVAPMPPPPPPPPPGG